MTLPRCWKLGSTTVREPTRILDALASIEQDCSGFDWNLTTQRILAQSLIDRKVYVPHSNLSTEDLEKIGRTWISPISQLGFVEASTDRPLQLLPPGRAWLTGQPAISLWQRQLLKFQIPNPTGEFSSRRYSGFNLRPFVMLLRALWEAFRAGIRLKKKAIAQHILTCLTFEEFDARYSQNSEWFHRFDSDIHPTLRTYSDLTVRYASMSGIFSTTDDFVTLDSANFQTVESIWMSNWDLLPGEDYFQVMRNHQRPSTPRMEHVTYYGGLSVDSVRMFEASIEALNLALVGLGIPTSKMLNEPLAATAPQVGLLGSALELAVSGVLVQAQGVRVIQRDDQMFRTTSDILDQFKSILSKNSSELTFLTGGMDKPEEHIGTIIKRLQQMTLVPKIRARALHLGRGPNYDMAIALARDIARFLELLYSSSYIHALLPSVPFPMNIVKEKEILINDIRERLQRVREINEKYDLIISALYLVLPDVPESAPDWLSGIEKLAVSPAESDVSYALQLWEQASPVTLMKVRPSSSTALPVRLSREESALPVSPQQLGLAITGTADKIHTQLSLARGKIIEKKKLGLQPIEKELIYELFEQGIQSLLPENGVKLTAQDMSILLVSAIFVQGTEAPYYFILDHFARFPSSRSREETETISTETQPNLKGRKDDLRQLTSEFQQCVRLGPESWNEKLARIEIEIGQFERGEAISSDNTNEINRQLSERNRAHQALVSKIRVGKVTGGEEMMTIMSEAVKTEGGVGGNEALRRTLSLAPTAESDPRPSVIRHLCKLPLTMGSVGSLRQILSDNSLKSVHTEVRKALRILDFLNYAKGSGDSRKR